MSSAHVFAFAFWCAACLLLYTYAGYPLWIYWRSRLHPRPVHQSPLLPSVSIILAVHNGADRLRQKIDHLMSLDYPQDRLQIVISSDGSTDDTDSIIEEYPNSSIKYIRCSEHRGKAAAVNAGMLDRKSVV